MSEKKRTIYDVMFEELNISPDDTPDEIAKNLKKSVDSELSTISAKKTVYDTETKQSIKNIKSNVDNALSAIKKISQQVGAIPADDEPEEEVPEEPPVEEPAPEPEPVPEEPVGPIPPDQLPTMSQKVSGPTIKDKIKAYSGVTEGEKRLNKKGIKENGGVNLAEPISKEKGKQIENRVAAAAMPPQPQK